ncbi:MAG TPA: TIM-barrel domain-containing protein, partial [Pseudomonadales bacterium]|nr:TIM-barrel domain-containing protein [Pseudomonadales bacterium]
IYSRWGGWGEQRYPIHFSGDARACWEMLQFEIPFTTSSGNAGCFFWAHDTGGFSGERDPETYARWVQFSAFSTSLRLHSVGESLDRRPWLWGQPFEDSMRQMFHLRAQLLPYIYSSVYECYDQMLPLLRPMYLEYPTQPEAYQYPGQYLFGDDFLVAPITTPGVGTNYLAKQTIWFPPGQWFNFLTGEKYEGGRIATVSADIYEIPVYVRAGVPIAMQPYTSRMTTAPLTNLIVRVFPGPAGESVLYEDDGQSQGYLKGEFATTRITSEPAGGIVHIHIAPAQGRFKGQPQRRAYQIELPATKRAQQVMINGVPGDVSYNEKLSMNVITVKPHDIDQAIEVDAAVTPVDP